MRPQQAFAPKTQPASNFKPTTQPASNSVPVSASIEPRQSASRPEQLAFQNPPQGNQTRQPQVAQIQNIPSPTTGIVSSLTQQVPVAENQTQEDQDYYVKPADTRPKFDAICDMCGDKIQVPFQPDGSRPTFCKDCLKEYQRMTAKEKLAQEQKMERQAEDEQVQKLSQPEKQSSQVVMSQQVPQRINRNRPVIQFPQKPAEKNIQQKMYAPQEQPMMLSQMQYIAPKKFNSQRNRPTVNLDEVRNLINSSIQQKNLND